MRTEGARSEGGGTLMPGSLAGGRVQFWEERQALQRAPQADQPEAGRPPRDAVAAMLGSREGLAQAMLLAEVLGKPRALRPYGRR